MAGSGRVRHLVLQPTPFCNLDCRYCYLPDRAVRGRMCLDLVERIARVLFEQRACARALAIVWHAGEPLTLPPGYYEEAFRRIARAQPAGIAIRHHIQTNGVLIDRAWCDLFERWQVAVGVSVDGPAALHDRDRVTRRGAGSHAQVMRGIALLQEHAIPFKVITVLTARALEFPDELYDFYLAAGISQVGFNIEEIEGQNRASSLAGEGVERRYRRFLRRFWQLAADDPRLEVREIAWARRARLNLGGPTVPNEQTAPFVTFSVDWRGRWSTFSPELLGAAAPALDDFVFGSFEGPRPLERPSGAFGRALAEIQAGVAACERDCAYFRWCGGGAPANKWFETGTLGSTETLYCRLGVQALMDVAFDPVGAAPAPAAGERLEDGRAAERGPEDGRAAEEGPQDRLAIGPHRHFLGDWDGAAALEIRHEGAWRPPTPAELRGWCAPAAARAGVSVFSFPGGLADRVWALDLERILPERQLDPPATRLVATVAGFLAAAAIVERAPTQADLVALAPGGCHELAGDATPRDRRQARRTVLNLGDESLFAALVGQGLRLRLAPRQGLCLPASHPLRLELPATHPGGTLALALAG